MVLNEGDLVNVIGGTYEGVTGRIVSITNDFYYVRFVGRDGKAVSRRVSHRFAILRQEVEDEPRDVPGNVAEINHNQNEVHRMDHETLIRIERKLDILLNLFLRLKIE